MTQTIRSARRATAYDLLFMQSPWLWPHFPFLPLIRAGRDPNLPDCGLLYAAGAVSGRSGLRCTVFLVNLLALPASEAALLQQPRCSYATFDELADAGWVVD